MSKNFIVVSREWMYLKKLSVKYSSYVKYENVVNVHLVQYFGKYCLQQINDDMIINYFQTKINEEKYSLSTLSTIRYVLKSILEYAQSKYAIKCPNFNFIKLAKKKSDCKVLTSDQIMLLGKYSFNHFEPISLAILLSLYGGLRIGEFSGLKWKDIDFDNDLIRVERTVERLKAPANSATKTQLMLMDPKTATSKRIIPIPSFVMEYVKKYYQHHAIDDEHFIYTNSKNISDPRSIQYGFHRIYKLYNFKSNFHSLRHTYATNCVMNNIDIKSLSEMLGHSKVSTTLNLYVHSSLDFKKTQINKIEKPSFFAE